MLTHTHAHSCMHAYMHYTHRFQEGVRFLSVHKAWVGQFLVKSDMLNSGLHFPNTLSIVPVHLKERELSDLLI